MIPTQTALVSVPVLPSARTDTTPTCHDICLKCSPLKVGNEKNCSHAENRAVMISNKGFKSCKQSCRQLAVALCVHQVAQFHFRSLSP